MSSNKQDLVNKIEAAIWQRQGRREGSEIRFLCFLHADHHPSARYKAEKVTWFCDVCKKGGGIKDLAEKLGIPMSNNKSDIQYRLEESYIYESESGVEYYVIDRKVSNIQGEDGKFKKKFDIRHLVDGKYVYNRKGLNIIPYLLPELRAAKASGLPVRDHEGEKKADVCKKLGLPATSMPFGANAKIEPSYIQELTGAEVYIYADNDEPGQQHALAKAKALYGKAKTIKIIHLPGLQPKGDIVDFILAGGTKEQILKCETGTPPYMPEKEIPLEINDSGNSERKSQATLLIELTADLELFHTPNGDCYATLSIDNHQETWPLQSKGFQGWLKKNFFEQNGKVPSTQAYKDTLGVLEGRALFNGNEYPVFTRFAEYNGSIYLDLVNERWESVEITAAGWRVISNPPVKFRRAKGMLSLPNPIVGGSIEELRPLVNVPSDSDWAQVKAWLVQSLRPTGPYPILGLNGEAGSAKTTLCRMLRALVDPNIAPTRAEPRETRDLMIACTNGWIVCFDNLSYLAEWLSDAICRLATGGGFSTRELYTDQDEIIFDAMRPVILNSIEELVIRGDLVDRSIILTLPSIPELLRHPEKVLWAEFEAKRPLILGGLLNAVAMALKNEASIKLDNLPRMADFAIWVTAAEPALDLAPGEFMAAYDANRKAANDTVLETSSVATGVIALICNKDYEGSPTLLLKDLGGLVSEEVRKQKFWPKSPKGLRDSLNRLAPHLRTAGIIIELTKTPGSGSRCRVSIRKMGSTTVASVASVATNSKEASTQPSHLEEQPSQDTPKLAQVQDQGDGCDTCDTSKPIFSNNQLVEENPTGKISISENEEWGEV